MQSVRSFTIFISLLVNIIFYIVKWILLLHLGTATVPRVSSDPAPPTAVLLLLAFCPRGSSRPVKLMATVAIATAAAVVVAVVNVQVSRKHVTPPHDYMGPILLEKSM